MATFLPFALMASAISLCRGMQRPQGVPNESVKEPYPKERLSLLLMNSHDTVFVSSIEVGGTPVRCIMDTGSTEQVVFSSKCELCGEHMYNCDGDHQCQWGNHTSTQNYGSGQTFSTEAHVTMTATSSDQKHSVNVPQQMVWLVTDAQLDFELDGTMQCIFGLGPAQSAIEFAKLDYALLKQYIRELGDDKANQYKPELKKLEKQAEFMKGVTWWQAAAGIETMSFCLHPQLGKDGTLFLNDDAPEQYPDAFIDVPTSGLYWQTPITRVEIPFEHGAIQACTSGGNTCTAIMDTGTSLVGAPSPFIKNLSTIMSSMVSKHGCEPDSLGNYPDLEMWLGQHKLTLPPHSYVCMFDHNEWGDEGDGDSDDGDWEDHDDDWRSSGSKGDAFKNVRQRMRHVHAFRKAHEPYKFVAKADSNEARNSQYFCAPCFFEMDQQDDDGEEWLFGIPFFREYYTTFRTNKKNTLAKKILFAKADDECRPRESASHEDWKFRSSTGPGRPSLNRKIDSTDVQRISLHKLRLPSSRSSPADRLLGTLRK